MKIVTTMVVEQQSLAAQEMPRLASAGLLGIAPGGTTTCLGSTCTSCCCSAAMAA